MRSLPLTVALAVCGLLSSFQTVIAQVKDIVEIHVVGHTSGLGTPEALIAQIKEASDSAAVEVLLLAGGKKARGDNLDEKLNWLAEKLPDARAGEETSKFYINNSINPINSWLEGLDSSTIGQVNIHFWTEEVYFEGSDRDLRETVPNLGCWGRENGFTGITVPPGLVTLPVLHIGNGAEPVSFETVLFASIFFGAGQVSDMEDASPPLASRPKSGCWIEAGNVERAIGDFLQSRPEMAQEGCNGSGFAIEPSLSERFRDHFTCAEAETSADPTLAVVTPDPTIPDPQPSPAVPVVPKTEPKIEPVPDLQPDPPTVIVDPVVPAPDAPVQPVIFPSIRLPATSVSVASVMAASVRGDRLRVVVPDQMAAGAEVFLKPAVAGSVPGLSSGDPEFGFTNGSMPGERYLAQVVPAGSYEVWALVDQKAVCEAGTNPFHFEIQMANSTERAVVETKVFNRSCAPSQDPVYFRVLRLEIEP